LATPADAAFTCNSVEVTQLIYDAYRRPSTTPHSVRISHSLAADLSLLQGNEVPLEVYPEGARPWILTEAAVA